MQDVTEQLGNVREVLLQTDGAATLGIVSAIDNVNNIVTAQYQPFGTRLLQAGLTVDIVNPANNLRRGSITLGGQRDPHKLAEFRNPGVRASE
jgi:hypothetical protein